MNLFSAVRNTAYVVEEVLLGYAGILSGKFREAVRVILREDALYPHINGKGFCSVHTEEKDTFGDLRTDTFYLL